MITIINITPHTINLINSLGENIEIKASGTIARCEETTEIICNINNIPIISKKLGKITNLPEPKSDIIYIVSLPVAQKAGRSDVFAIGESIRNRDGQIIGAKSLASFI